MGCGPVAKCFLGMSGVPGTIRHTESKQETTTKCIFLVQGVALKFSGEHKLLVQWLAEVALVSIGLRRGNCGAMVLAC